MNGPADRKISRQPPLAFPWMSPLSLSLGVLLLQLNGCASSAEQVAAKPDPPAVTEAPSKAQPQKAPRQGKSIQSQSSAESSRQLQQDKKNILAEAPEADSDQPRKAKKKKPVRKQPSGEAVLPPEPSKPPAVGGSGG